MPENPRSFHLGSSSGMHQGIVVKHRPRREWQYSIEQLRSMQLKANLRLERHEARVEAQRQKVEKDKKRLEDIERKGRGLNKSWGHWADEAERYHAVAVRSEDGSITYVLPDHKVIRRYKLDEKGYVELDGEGNNVPIIEED